MIQTRAVRHFEVDVVTDRGTVHFVLNPTRLVIFDSANVLSNLTPRELNRLETAAHIAIAEASMKFTNFLRDTLGERARTFPGKESPETQTEGK